MTIDIDARIPTAHGGAISKPSAAVPWLVAGVLLMAAIGLRHIVAANTDVSWLLIAGERLLDGQHLYRDIIETNPPMAVLVYIPATLIGRVFGIPAEIVIDGLVFAAIGASLALVGRILRSSAVLDGVSRWPLALLAIAVLAIMPTNAFAQREHIAIIGLLPAIAVLAMRVQREHPPWWAVVVAGLSLGFALSFKPHFAVALLIAFGIIAVSARCWRIVVAPENFIAAGIAAFYLAGTLILFPDYFTVIGPLARDVYLPIGTPFAEMLQKPVVLLWAAAVTGALFLMRGRWRTPPFLIAISLSVGFAVIFFLQRKGWPYHSLPMMVFAFLAPGLGVDSLIGRAGRNHLTVAIAVIPSLALFVNAMTWFEKSFDARALQAAIAPIASHQRIMVISGEGGMGHPLTRALGATWGSREQNLWIAAHISYLKKQGTIDPATLAKLETYAAQERQWLVEDFQRSQPAIVLVDNLTDDWGGWMHRHPELAHLLDNYDRIETFEGIDILRRRAG